MDTSVENGIELISASMSRASGLYQLFAQRHGSQYGTIRVLYALHLLGPVTQKQICDSYEIPKQTVNNVIRQLKADDYIVLKPDKRDKREKKVTLTPAGKAYTKKLLTPFFGLNEKIAERVGIELIAQLGAGLDRFCDAVEMEMELAAVAQKWGSQFSEAPRP